MIKGKAFLLIASNEALYQDSDKTFDQIYYFFSWVFI